MPRPRNMIPKFSVDKTGRAFCKVDGKFISLGRGDNPDSRQRYASILQRVTQGLPVVTGELEPVKSGLTINELCLAFLMHAKGEYIDRTTGKSSAEYDCYKGAVKPLRELFGATLAADFGPNALRAVREQYIASGWTRSFIAKQVSRVRHIWRWATAREMIPATVLEGLRSLEPLKPGRTAAVESIRRRAVPQEHIDTVKQRLKERTRDLVDLMLLTAARPGELLSITTEMIEDQGELWAAKLEHHKNAHRGQSRTLLFGRAAQTILMKYIDPDNPEKRLFPIARKTFGQAVKDACIKADVPIFTPHWLRHSALTRVRDELGIEAAQAIGGHANPNMTTLYTSRLDKLATEAAKRLG